MWGGAFKVTRDLVRKYSKAQYENLLRAALEVRSIDPKLSLEP